MPLFILFQHPDLHKNHSCFKTIKGREPEEENKAMVVEVNYKPVKPTYRLINSICKKKKKKLEQVTWNKEKKIVIFVLEREVAPSLCPK